MLVNERLLTGRRSSCMVLSLFLFIPGGRSLEGCIMMKVLMASIVLALIPALAFAEPREVRIGATLPLTGRLAEAGLYTKRGLEMGRDEFSNNQLKISLVFEDNQHEARLAASSAHKLLEQDGVSVIVSMWDMADVVAPMAEKKGVPHLAVRWDPEVAQKFNGTFTFESSYFSYVESLVKLLRSLGAKSVAVLTEESKGWVLASDYLSTVAAQQGIRVTSNERYVPDAVDYGTMVLKSLKASPDYVVLLGNPPHTQNLIRKLKELAPQQRFTGYFEVFEDLSIVDGIPFVAQFEIAPWFAERFQQRFGEAPKGRAAQAYDMVQLVARAAGHSSGKLSFLSLQNELNSGALPDGAAGALSLRGGKSVESECVWMVVRNTRAVRFLPPESAQEKE